MGLPKPRVLFPRLTGELNPGKNISLSDSGETSRAIAEA